LFGMEKEARCERGLSVGSDRATGGSEWIDERLVDDGLVCIPMFDEMVGSVARRDSWFSCRAFKAPGEKRAAIALRVF
jgi:hypothetical protein